MKALRFTTNKKEENITSEDQVNKVKFSGLCAYNLDSLLLDMQNDDWYEGYTDEELINIIVLKQVKFDNWHASNTDGMYVIVDCDFVSVERDNQDFQGNRAVIVDNIKYIGSGKIDMKSDRYKIIESTYSL